jgi:hypothetical protein
MRAEPTHLAAVWRILQSRRSHARGLRTVADCEKGRGVKLRATTMHCAASAARAERSQTAAGGRGRTEKMPLIAGRGHITDRFRGVSFMMHDGKKQILCEISNLALVDLATRRGWKVPRKISDIYLTCEGVIQDVAARKYDAGHCERDGGIVIRASDLV